MVRLDLMKMSLCTEASLMFLMLVLDMVQEVGLKVFMLLVQSASHIPTVLMLILCSSEF